MEQDKPFCPIVNKGGEEIITLTVKALEDNGQQKEAKECKERLSACNDPNEVLKIILEYVVPCTEHEYEYLMESMKNYYDYAHQKPMCPMIGANGNVFNLLALVGETLRENNQFAEVKEVNERVMSCHSYEEALSIMCEYVKPCTQAEYEEQCEFESMKMYG